MINKYITDIDHYRYQISNNRTNPEHLINRKIQSTEHFKNRDAVLLSEACDQTLLTFCYSASTRRCPSASLRAHALFLCLLCVLLLQGRTQGYYRAASFATETHLKTLSRRVLLLQRRTWTLIALRPHAGLSLLYCVSAHLPFTVPASRRTFPSLNLRPFRYKWYEDFRTNPNSQIYRSIHAP